LLVAGTELGVFVSFNDGDQWQPLQLNLPPTSMRDILPFTTNDLNRGHARPADSGYSTTSGALRQASADVMSSDVFLFKPAEAILIPQSTDNGTPTQKDEAEADNPA